MALAVMLQPRPAFSDEISLFKGGQQIGHYKSLLDGLNPGDTLVFENGRRFTFEKNLGSGGTTQVLQVSDRTEKSYALHLPLNTGSHWNLKTPYVSFINITIDNHAPLRKAKLVPDMIDSSRNTYVLFELVSEKRTLYQFLRKQSYIEPNKKSWILTDLYKFAKKLAPFSEIVDFSPGQVIHDGKKWILLDYMQVTVLQNEISAHAFNAHYPFADIDTNLYRSLNMFEVSEVDNILQDIKAIIYQERLIFTKNNMNPISKEPFFITQNGKPANQRILGDILALDVQRTAMEQSPCLVSLITDQL